MKKKKCAVLIVGAGISGIRSAIDLALMDHAVTLIDKAPCIGGALLQLDHQFPSNACGICRMLPIAERNDVSQYCMRRGLYHENIEILLSTEMTALAGHPGSFTAALRSRAAIVDPEKCIGCGECRRVCPVAVPDDFNAGLSMRKAIFLPSPFSRLNDYVVDLDACTRCGECEKACPTNAVDFSRTHLEREIEAGAVILAAGFETFDPGATKNPYCYGHPNVITSVEFERLISGSGPLNGRLLRPGDQQPVRRAAWFQCVGSRDLQENADFCSSACCMYSMKEAVLAKRLSPEGMDAAIFYMDMRTFGKNFQEYRDQAENRHGVRFVRSRIHSVIPEDEKGPLKIFYMDDDGKMISETVDLIILATGQRPAPRSGVLSDISGTELNQWGFIQTQPFSLTRTSREGVYVSGSCAGLREISESVIQADAASLEAFGFLAAKGLGPTTSQESVENFRDVSWEKPQISVVFCTCGDALAPSLDRAEIIEKIQNMDGVRQVHLVQHVTADKEWRALLEVLDAGEFNRVLLCSCNPHLFAGKLRELGKRAGLSPEMIGIVNLGQALFQYLALNKDRAFREMLSKIAAGVEKLKSATPVSAPHTRIEDAALVVGAGIAGISAALAIADQGFSVNLVEQSPELGGNLRFRRRTIEGYSPRILLEESISKLESHKNVRIYKNARIIQSHGKLGHFTTRVEKENGATETLVHGVTILATGGKEASTDLYGYGSSERIITQGELEGRLDDGVIDPEALEAVVMIQCVGSREAPRNYCSRICCASALKNAMFLKEKHPDVQIYIFYRDMMSYGFMETYYTKARKAGVIFIRYDVNQKPAVRIVNDRPEITAIDPILGRPLTVAADILVLSTGVTPYPVQALAEKFGVETDQNGFFQETESKWRPVDLSQRGIFTCGMAHSPRDIAESAAMAEAAAMRSLRFLAKSRLSGGDSAVASVDERLCTGCMTCVELCPFQAISFSETSKSAAIDGALCQGCGVCMAACPVSAIRVWNYTPAQMYAQIEAVLEN